MGATTSAPAAAIKPTLPADARLVDAINLLTSGKWSPADYQAWHELHLAHQIAKAKPAASDGAELDIEIYLSESGNIVVKFKGSRYPITFFPKNALTFIDHFEEFKAFVDKHRAALKMEPTAEDKARCAAARKAKEAEYKAKQATPAKPATIQPAGPIAPAITPELLAALGAMLTAQQSA